MADMAKRKAAWHLAVSFGPAFAAFGLAFLTGNYQTPDVSSMWWNASIFPYGFPVGLALAVVAVWRDDVRFALAAGPFLSPYLSIHGWLFALLPIGAVKRFPRWLAVLIVAGAWLAVLAWRMARFR